MDPTKAPPTGDVKLGVGILSYKYFSFLGGAGSGVHGLDPTKAPPPYGIKFGAGILSSCSCK